MEQQPIRFNRPSATGRELEYIAEAIRGGHLAGDGPFTRRCHQWLAEQTGTRKGLLTHSCTAALEMAALLLDLAPDDEVIMPSYTFVSTANAFVLRRAVPVFIDIRPDTLNIDETLIEQAITPRTKAIVVVHYAGVSCAMDEILAIARRHGLAVVEDAAQGLGSTYKGRALGSIAELGALSFHETKNAISGEGGALLVNGDESLVIRAETIREKGTDRSRFFRGEVDKYTWQEPGSSFLPGELVAAFLLAQLEQLDATNAARMAIWDRYHAMFEPLEQDERLRRPIIPAECMHNAHMYYVLLPTGSDRQKIMADIREKGVQTAFHYVPLHSSPAGRAHTRVAGSMAVTDDLSERLLRLPLWPGMTTEQQNLVVEAVRSVG